MAGEKDTNKYGLMEVVKVSETKNGQFRITLKKRIAQELNIRGTDYLVFLKNDRGEIVVKKLKLKDMHLE